MPNRTEKTTAEWRQLAQVDPFYVIAVFTCHVLQHLEGIDVVESYLTEARRVLRPTGTMMVQLGLHSAPLRMQGRLLEELRLWVARNARARGARDLTFRVRLYRR